jgi:hypothetical protein
MKTVKFPDDFVKLHHEVIPMAVQFLYTYKNSDTNEMISIVSGGYSLHGDGVRTFEMWDTKNMDDPRGYMTKEEIQEWLDNHPIEGE